METLKNPLAIKEGKKTPHTLLFHNFMIRLFDIELNFNDPTVFSINEGTENSRTRKLYHVTRVDICTAIILQAISHATVHQINNVNYTAIYEVLTQWYEDPISFHDFIISMKKMNKLGLITIFNHRANGRFDIQLNHITTDEGEKSRFVVLHPVVFTKAFTSLSLSHWKLYIMALLQTGDKENSLITRLFDNSNHNHMMYKGLKQFLHKHQSSDVRKVLEDLLTKEIWKGEPLLHIHQEKPAYIKSYKGRFYKAEFCINPAFVLKHQKGMKYHHPLETPMKYKRFASFLESLLQEYGIADYIGESSLFSDIILYLKDRGKTVTRLVMSRLKEYINRFGKAPTSIMTFIKEQSRSRIQATIEKLAKEEGVFDWIAPPASLEVCEERLYEFSSKLSYYSQHVIRGVFKKLKPLLVQKYSIESGLTYEDYCGEVDLEQLSMLRAIRNLAYTQKKSPFEYRALEREAVEQLRDGKKEIEVTDFMFRKIDDLSYYPISPKITSDFKLEDLVYRYIQQS